jgi:hypothetical protein
VADDRECERDDAREDAREEPEQDGTPVCHVRPLAGTEDDAVGPGEYRAANGQRTPF